MYLSDAVYVRRARVYVSSFPALYPMLPIWGPIVGSSDGRYSLTESGAK